MKRDEHRFLNATAVLVSLFSLLPVGFIVWVSVQTGWQTFVELVVRRRVGELLINTAMLEFGTLPLSAAYALLLAWLTERTDLPGARLWSLLAVAPLAIPAFVHGYSWVSIASGFHGLPAAVLISVLAYSPFLYLPLAAQLRRLDPALEDVAASLGHGPWLIFVRVVLPQLRIAVSGGCLLVALHLLGEYGLYAMIQFDTFTTAIVDQFQSSYNGPAANMLAGVLVVCCAAVVGAEWFARGERRYARIGTGAARMPDRRRLGPLTPLCLLFCVTGTGLAIGVPLVTLARWLAVGGSAIWSSDVASALLQSIEYAAAGALVTTAAALPMAWLAVRRPSRLHRAMEACHLYVGSLPGVVVALALVTIVVRVALPLYQTVATVFAAYLLLFLPRALIGLKAGIVQAPIELERAAIALGRSPGQAIRAVTLRLAAPGAAASASLVALGIVNELTATLMLAPNGTRTLATEFWSLSSEIDYAAAAPYALMMVVISMPATLLLHTQSKRMAGR